MNSLCCQQITGEHTQSRFRLFIFSIFIHIELHRLCGIWTGWSYKGT